MSDKTGKEGEQQRKSRFKAPRVKDAHGKRIGLRSKEHAQAVQTKRHRTGKAGLAAAVKRWNKRHPSMRVNGPCCTGASDGGSSAQPKHRRCPNCGTRGPAGQHVDVAGQFTKVPGSHMACPWL